MLRYPLRLEKSIQKRPRRSADLSDVAFLFPPFLSGEIKDIITFACNHGLSMTKENKKRLTIPMLFCNDVVQSGIMIINRNRLNLLAVKRKANGCYVPLIPERTKSPVVITSSITNAI